MPWPSITLPEAARCPGIGYHTMRRMCLADQVRCLQTAVGAHVRVCADDVAVLAQSAWTGMAPRPVKPLARAGEKSCPAPVVARATPFGRRRLESQQAVVPPASPAVNARKGKEV